MKSEVLIKRSLGIASTLLLIISCKQDNLSDYLGDALSGSVQLSVKLGNSFEGGTGAVSPWVHALQESVDLTISSTTSAFTQTITFNPNDPATFPSTTLPYGSYNWSIGNSGTGIPVASSLYVYGSSATPFSVGTATTTLPLTLDTDFALVTVTTENIEEVVVSQNNVDYPLSTQDNYFYGYINSNFTDFGVSITSLDGLGASNVLSAPVAYTHYNYILTYPSFSDLQVTLELTDVFLLEDVNVDMTVLDTDNDGVPDSADLCPNTPVGSVVDEFGCNINGTLFLDANGVTIKAFDTAQVGDSGAINGVLYLVVDETTLREMITNGEDVSNVCTSKVTNMAGLFNGIASFNQDISTWDTSNVTSMRYILNGATAFNQDISNWDVSSVVDLEQALSNCTNFNADLSNWDVSNVTNMRALFNNSVSFNQDISAWNTGNVTNMEFLFAGALSFNQDISNWNTQNVASMANMFSGTRDFNQNISSWNTSNVSSMRGMFDFTVSFNQDISGLNVSNVSNMEYMFNGAQAFNQDLSAWNVNNVFFCTGFSNNTAQWILPKPNLTNCTP